MLKIRRNELLSNAAYQRVRAVSRRHMLGVKRRRRVALGPHMSLLFENRETILYHIQEVLLIEGVTDELRIARELTEYNRLIPGPNELLATLFLEFTDRSVGNAVVDAIGDLDEDLALRFGDALARGRFVAQDASPLTAVNYVRFTLGAEAYEDFVDCHSDVTLECANPAYRHASLVPFVTCLYLASDLLTSGGYDVRPGRSAPRMGGIARERRHYELDSLTAYLTQEAKYPCLDPASS